MVMISDEASALKACSSCLLVAMGGYFIRRKQECRCAGGRREGGGEMGKKKVQRGAEGTT